MRPAVTSARAPSPPRRTPRPSPAAPRPSFLRSLTHTSPTADSPPPTPRPADASRREAISAVSGLTESFVDAVNLGVVDVFENQKRIESDARALRDKSAKFARVTGEWVAIVDGFDAELRKIGDFERWIRAVEFDLDNITGVVERVARRRGECEEGDDARGEARDDVDDDPSEGDARR